jgi:TRAP-type C4-dicarboxylate transport system permease small subunit
MVAADRARSRERGREIDREALKQELPRSVAIERFVLALVMALLCLITMANVIVRYFTNVSFAFTEEISVFLLVVLTLVGASTAFYRGQHIAIVFLVERFSERGRKRFALFALFVSTLMFALLVWYGARMAWDDYRYDVTTPALGLPQWIYSAALPVLSLLVILRLLGQIRRRSIDKAHAAATGRSSKRNG